MVRVGLGLYKYTGFHTGFFPCGGDVDACKGYNAYVGTPDRFNKILDIFNTGAISDHHGTINHVASFQGNEATLRVH